MLRTGIRTTYLSLRLLVRRGVGVEKLAQREFAEIASRQEALQTIFPSLLDIFYHPNFGFLQKRRVFQQPQGLSPTISECDGLRPTEQKTDDCGGPKSVLAGRHFRRTHRNVAWTFLADEPVSRILRDALSFQ
jgi:hypothetical protein